jgi:hypothetical protein
MPSSTGEEENAFVPCPLRRSCEELDPFTDRSERNSESAE